MRSQRFLVTPLDWGLGHASRCIPIIQALQKAGNEVMVASSGSSLDWLKSEFPELKFFTLPAYNPVYPKSGSMMLKMAAQLPKFVRTIRQENIRLQEIVKSEKIDVVISDNRYGCYTPLAKTVFITHQVNLIMPKHGKLIEPFINKINHSFIQRFNHCWVPASSHDLFPALTKSNLTTRLIGNLSRLEVQKDAEVKYDALVICTGPEPQKSMFQKLVTEQIAASGKKALVISSDFSSGDEEKFEAGQITTVKRLSTEEFSMAVAQSKVVVSRSGYSTIMDMQKVGAKAVFIPCPGQTEQEYISKQLAEQKIAGSYSQKDFNFIKAMKESKGYRGFSPCADNTPLLHDAIKSL